jgi:aldose 1-epimerase
MAFAVTTARAEAGGVSGETVTLSDLTSGASIEVWPHFGFNCLRWAVGGKPVFYTASDWATNPVATRSGHPILFPFPNRLRHGRFTFEGREYQLPLNESSGQHAIHGFTPKTPWRVVGATAGEESATVTGEFQISVDRPDVLACWPGDLVLRVTYTVTASALEVRCVVRNPSPGNVPFGLGYHPYFVLPSLPGLGVNEFVVTAPANSLWVAEGGIATGEKVPVPAALDFTEPRPVGDADLDCLLGYLPGGFRTVATVTHPDAAEAVTVEADAAFRDLLLFTPPHRTALAVEPYTCTSDALNLQGRGVDAGLRVLAPGAEFAALVRYAVVPK